jgi:hypothetical protein
MTGKYRLTEEGRIQKIKNLYKNGVHPGKGKQRSEETKRKISENNKKSPSIGQFKKGHKFLNEWKENYKKGKDSNLWRGGHIISKRRENAKRRSYGFDPINEKFDDSEAHHIDRNHVIFIPRELHRSIWHSLNKPETMNTINTKVFIWVLSGNKWR